VRQELSYCCHCYSLKLIGLKLKVFGSVQGTAAEQPRKIRASPRFRRFNETPRASAVRMVLGIVTRKHAPLTVR
jgi:hypothetical protein